MRRHGIVNRIGLSAALLGALAVLGTSAAPASAAVGPQWSLHSLSNTTVAPGGELKYFIQANNVGDTAMDGSQISFLVKLPSGLVALEAEGNDPEVGSFECFDGEDGTSPVAGKSTVLCKNNNELGPEQLVSPNFQKVFLTAEADPSASGTLVAEVEISGGGAASVATVDPVTVSSEPLPFGVDAFDGLVAADPAGTVLTQAGGHPYDATVDIDFNTEENPTPLKGHLWPVEEIKDVFVELPPGFAGNPTVADTCTLAELAQTAAGFAVESLCPSASQVGVTSIRLRSSPDVPEAAGPFPLFRVVPPPGVPARFGFNILGTVIALDAELRSDDDYGFTVASRNISQAFPLAGVSTTFWGVPASSDHDRERACPGVNAPEDAGPTCTSSASERPLLRLPTSCTAPGEGLPTTLRIDSWDDPGDFAQRTFDSHEAPGYPYPEEIEGVRQWGPEVGTEDCEKVPVKGTLEAKPTSRDTETSSGLTVHVEVPNPGMDIAGGIASSDLKKVRVGLPRGITINPSQAEGLGVCTPAQYESTELSFHPTTKGCPEDSKIGTVEVVTPLLEEKVLGDVYIAQQDDPATTTPGAENPFDSLLAIYVVLHNEQRGILVKLPGRVETDGGTGRIVTTFDDLPQLPFDSFDFKFREGARAPLVTPPTCGDYTTEAEITGWSKPGKPIVSKSSFRIDRGIGGGPCPAGGIPPFKPGFSAGSVNPSAGVYSPFLMRLTRNDGEQDMTKFSSILPPGVSAKIAGVEKCSEAAIASAKTKGGRQELAAPSCPANSQIGRSLAGAGVGSVLTYVPGKLYFAGPYNGAPLSVVAITPAVAGPFDVGTVVVREALSLDPVTAEVHVDGDRSDPIPHILEGIPLKLRDLRVYVDRENYTINPTGCDSAQVRATLFGSYADVFNPADDVPVGLASPYEAANCASLGFKPRLKINLEGGTRRGDFPGLEAVLTPRPGDANLDRAAVVLPKSAFLEQGHIRTICTRVQWMAKACPKGSIYGYAKAWTPLLDEPLRGPVYLRSSENKLPDMVLDLGGVVDIEAAGRIDSVPLGGGDFGIRATFAAVPDAPISRVVLTMRGGKKGLIVNSRNLCAGRGRARVKLEGQNGKPRGFRPVVRPDCGRNGRATPRP